MFSRWLKARCRILAGHPLRAPRKIAKRIMQKWYAARTLLMQAKYWRFPPPVSLKDHRSDPSRAKIHMIVATELARRQRATPYSTWWLSAAEPANKIRNCKHINIPFQVASHFERLWQLFQSDIDRNVLHKVCDTQYRIVTIIFRHFTHTNEIDINLFKSSYNCVNFQYQFQFITYY